MHVTLNLATSLDGRVAGPDGAPLALSCPEDLARVHRLRACVDAIIVGVGTVLADDPRLTARTDPASERQPTRVILDGRARTPAGARIVDDAADTLLFVAASGPGGPPAAKPPGTAELVPVSADDEGRLDVRAVLSELADRGLGRVLVEGGPTVARSMLKAGRVDLFSLYIAPRVLGTGPSLWEALSGLEVRLAQRSVAPLGEGLLVSYARASGARA